MLDEDMVDVVVLEASGGHTVPAAGRMPIDVTGDAEPVGDLLTELLAATVRIRGDEGVPLEVLEALRELPIPPAFRASPWLDGSRVIVVRDGIGSVGGLTVHYRDDRGLRIDFPEADTEDGDG